MNLFSEQDGFLLDAHRYLCDEMSEAERQSFEALLAANPSAQDAFVDQVLLEAACHRIASEGSRAASIQQPNDLSPASQAIQETSVRPALVSRSPVLVSSGGQTTAKDRSSRWDLSRTLAVVVTSCVMGVMIWGGGSALHELDSRRSFRDQLVTNDDVNAVGVWAELSADDSAAFNDDVDPDAEADLMLSPLFVSAELDVPDWMFAAVEALSLMDDVNLEESPSDGGPL
ncbi:hypothetical protein KOR42_25810 [Thalassoglobus neptunius]|uniref:Zinc-finger domain-containing protein n=1 Tax=Thalassoglobus neptunius TaxID=1938619 RepID=A0A5C5WYU4_9PLAN|nr:hypothetical protein [Thalassoglobus neptunius]TWT55770.1 hypothetical protein KOR42_25810 [Thalassoglobus neptunius]